MGIWWGYVIEILECEQTWNDDLDIVSAISKVKRENEAEREDRNIRVTKLFNVCAKIVVVAEYISDDGRTLWNMVAVT